VLAMEGSQGRRSTPALTPDPSAADAATCRPPTKLQCDASAGEAEGRKVSGGHSGRVTPVPIPNTEVKPASADGTWGEAPWESRSSPEFVTGPALTLGVGVVPRCSTGLERLGPLHSDLREAPNPPSPEATSAIAIRGALAGRICGQGAIDGRVAMPRLLRGEVTGIPDR